MIRKTKRLLIRPLRLSDHRVWQEAYANHHSKKNIWDREIKTKSDISFRSFQKILRTLKQYQKTEDFLEFGVFEKKTGIYVGSMTIMSVIRSITQSAHIGYAILNEHWGKGYGKESALAVIDIAFRDLKLHRIEAGIEPYNRRSILMARSMGLRKEGLKKRIIFKRGKWVDLVMYSATCEDFGIKWQGKLG